MGPNRPTDWLANCSESLTSIPVTPPGAAAHVGGLWDLCQHGPGAFSFIPSFCYSSAEREAWDWICSVMESSTLFLIGGGGGGGGGGGYSSDKAPWLARPEKKLIKRYAEDGLCFSWALAAFTQGDEAQTGSLCAKKSEEELRDQWLLGGGAPVPPAVSSRRCGSDARRSPPPVEANAPCPQQLRPPSEPLHWGKECVCFCFRATQAHFYIRVRLLISFCAACHCQLITSYLWHRGFPTLWDEPQMGGRDGGGDEMGKRRMLQQGPHFTFQMCKTIKSFLLICMKLFPPEILFFKDI